ncbi:hypothetical protein WUBG_14374, partial [Wuchereria bancrofti]
FAPADVRDQKMAEALKDWCVERAQRFEVQISDFISSWRDGYALNAILLSYNPELFSMNQIRDMRAVDRIEHAMSLAERYVNTPRLLHPKADVRDQKMAEALKDWCVERAQRFEVQISDFISSWRDGYALNAILLSYKLIFPHTVHHKYIMQFWTKPS